MSSLLILILLCGCSKSGSSFTVSRESLDTAFHAKLDGSEFEGYINFDDNLNMIVTVTSPAEIKGLSLTFCSDRVISTYDNVDDTFNFSDFSDSFSFLKIYKSLKKAALEGEFQKNASSSYVMTAEDVTLTADSEGNLISASLKNGMFVFGL